MTLPRQHCRQRLGHFLNTGLQLLDVRSHIIDLALAEHGDSALDGDSVKARPLYRKFQTCAAWPKA